MGIKNQDFFSAFVSISKAVSSTLNLPEVLDLIIKQSVDSLDLKAGALSLWNKKKNELELIVQCNLSDEFINKGPVIADKSIPDAIRTKRPVVITDIETDNRLQYPDACKKEGIKAILTVPILFREEIIGVLRLYDSESRDFTFREVEFITAVAEQGGIAIENARYMERVLNDHEVEIQGLTDWFKEMSGAAMLDG